MALYHFQVTQIKRSAGQKAANSAAYRAGEKLYSEYYGETFDFTRKGGIVHAEIMLPPHAPREYADRATLWDAVEHAEHTKKAQLAYSFDIAFGNGSGPQRAALSPRDAGAVSDGVTKRDTSTIIILQAVRPAHRQTLQLIWRISHELY